jgi:hypothetical protein
VRIADGVARALGDRRASGDVLVAASLRDRLQHIEFAG